MGLPTFVGLAVGSCAGPYSILDPANDEAVRIANLGWLMFAISGGVFALVVGLLLYALIRRDRAGLPRSVPPIALVVGGGVVLPIVVLPLVWVVSLGIMRDMWAAPDDGLTVDVVAHQWWYEVRHGDDGPVLIDEIRIPAGEDVLLRLSSTDVIHSFWAPRLGGKLDMVPGMINDRWIRVDEPGTFHGLCSEFCGIGHTKMRFRLVVMDAAEFAAWVGQGGSQP